MLCSRRRIDRRFSIKSLVVLIASCPTIHRRDRPLCLSAGKLVTDHSPLEEELQKPSLRRKADVVGGTDVLFQPIGQYLILFPSNRSRKQVTRDKLRNGNGWNVEWTTTGSSLRWRCPHCICPWYIVEEFGQFIFGLLFHVSSMNKNLECCDPQANGSA